MYKNNMVNMGAKVKNIAFVFDKLYKKCKLL